MPKDSCCQTNQNSAEILMKKSPKRDHLNPISLKIWLSNLLLSVSLHVLLWAGVFSSSLRFSYLASSHHRGLAHGRARDRSWKATLARAFLSSQGCERCLVVVKRGVFNVFLRFSCDFKVVGEQKPACVQCFSTGYRLIALLLVRCYFHKALPQGKTKNKALIITWSLIQKLFN